jgi:hypothetical protein
VEAAAVHCRAAAVEASTVEATASMSAAATVHRGLSLDDESKHRDSKDKNLIHGLIPLWLSPPAPELFILL